MEHAIEIKNLCKTLNSFELKDVSFSLPTGSIMGFIGENGAGKTTTIKLMLNQLKRNAGEILLLGKDNIKEEKSIKDRIGVVFDESYFHENVKPLQISHIMSKIYSDWDPKLFNEYLDRFHLPGNKITKEFSRGMKMKLSIATALAHHPELLILDEATSGLDPIVRNEILDIFLDFIQDEHHTVFFSSHITSDIEKIADYITFIHKGRLIFTKTKDEILQKYGILLCGKDEYRKIASEHIVGFQENKFGVRALIKDKEIGQRQYPNLTIDTATIEDIMLFYTKEEH